MQIASATLAWVSVPLSDMWMQLNTSMASMAWSRYFSTSHPSTYCYYLPSFVCVRKSKTSQTPSKPNGLGSTGGVRQIPGPFCNTIGIRKMVPQKPTNAVVDQVCKAWPRGVGGGALAKDGTGRSGALAEKNVKTCQLEVYHPRLEAIRSA